MRYPYHVTMIVAESEAELARQLAMSELGPIDGAGWFNVPLVDQRGGLYYASASQLTARNVDSVGVYQDSAAALSTLRYFVRDNAAGVLAFSNVPEAAGMVGAPIAFDDVLTCLGLSRAEPSPEA